MRRKVLLAGGAIVAIVGFLLFRPDTLFTDVRADESLEEAFAPEAASPSLTAAPQEQVPETTTTAGASATTVAIETITAGEFTGIDHQATGTATIYQSSGRYVLRFEEDTDIQNGPDLYVWLLASDGYGGGVPVEYLDLGTLKGNVGGQNYELPAEFDPALHRTVLIWCLRFAVPFAAAPLS